MKISQEIDLLIRARYPVINIISYEEERLLKIIKGIIKKEKDLFLWTLGEGFETIFSKVNSPDGGSQDPLMALNEIEKYQGDGIFILKDFHLFWKDNRVMVKLKSLSSRLKKTGKNIIILTPVRAVPIELKDTLTVIDFPLPDYDEMEEILDEIIEKVPSVKKTLSNVKEKLIKSALGLSENQAERVFFKCITIKGTLDESSIEQILQEKKQIIAETRALEFFPVTENLGTVGGLDELKRWVKKREKAFTIEAREYGLPTPKGLLLVGIPGTGKSLVAKAISGLWKMPLLRLDVGAIFGGLVGQSEENIRKAISISETIAPCILWIDEIEKGLFGQKSAIGDSGVTARVTATLLTWLQEKLAPVFVVATANDIKGFALEEIRMGRFDSIFFLDLPNEEERREIFKVHLEKRRPVIRTYDISHMALITEGYTGAEIEQLIIESMHNAFNEDGRDFTTKDIRETIEKFIPSSEMMSEKIDELRRWVKGNKIRSASLTVPQKKSIFERKIQVSLGNFTN